MFEKLQQLGEIKKNEPLKKHTSFQIGGPAKYFYIAKTREDLLQASILAEKLGLNYLILGGGSNVLISDNGFDGLVIKARNESFEIQDGKIVCGAGLTLGRFLGLVAQHGYVGVEFMAGIYGTIGGAICGNAGAYGKSLGEAVTAVEVYNKGEIKRLIKEQMCYDYRTSIIKKEGGVILRVYLELPKGDVKKFQQEVARIIKERNVKLPSEPSIGSVFKNIEVDKIQNLNKVLKGLDITEKEFRQDIKYKLPVGYITEKLDLKGQIIGGAKLSEKHGNVIINFNNATADDVAMLISIIKRKVRDKIGIQLEEEVKYIGFD